eukprot:2652904-Pyramimonas_sp.AAC.1
MPGLSVPAQSWPLTTTMMPPHSTPTLRGRREGHDSDGGQETGRHVWYGHWCHRTRRTTSA